MVEDQVTYPLTTALLAVPHAKVVRGFSDFGLSFVYVVFDDGTDLYSARSRVLEYLNSAAKRLPAGVSPALGPDASGVGFEKQYQVVVDPRKLQAYGIPLDRVPGTTSAFAERLEGASTSRSSPTARRPPATACRSRTCRKSWRPPSVARR